LQCGDDLVNPEKRSRQRKKGRELRKKKTDKKSSVSDRVKLLEEKRQAKEKEQEKQVTKKGKAFENKKQGKKKTEEKVEEEFLPSIGESLHNFVLSEKHSDVSFVVGDDKEIIRAHKVVLASRSPVFAAMLYTNFTESKDSERITVTDVDAEIF